MTETVITVQGRFSAFYPPERATLSLAVHQQGADRSGVLSSAIESADRVRGRISDRHDRAAGPVISWSSDTVQVWSEKPWNQDGLQLDPVFHARIGFTVTFTDFVELAGFVEHTAAVDGVAVHQIEWSLTETSRVAALAEVRSRAVKDAVAKASVFAQSIGLGTVRATALADEGMLSDQARGGSGGPSPALMRVGDVGSGPELSLRPEPIEVEAVVDARFLAT